MLPGRFSRLPHHVYKNENVDLLKLNVMYGANGAGKSNMIKAIGFLKSFVLQGIIPVEFFTETFKLDKEASKKDVYLGIEFIKDGIPYYYGLTINQGIIIEEELQISGLSKLADRNLFIRTDLAGKNKDLKINFSDELKADSEAALFSTFLQNEILERNKPVLFYMKNRQNKVFDIYRKPLFWFSRSLEFIFPETRVGGMASTLENDSVFKEFAIKTMQSFKTGIKDIRIVPIPAKAFFGEDDKNQIDRLVADLKSNPGKEVRHHTDFEELIFVLENDEPIAKKILFTHDEDDGESFFQMFEESDGTRRLMEYLPVFYKIVNEDVTFIIDEIERSIHCLLIKELIKKFSHDENTKGQLIFSTHESNLLDQEIFRPDEIWFAEKNKEGATEFTVLSDFKEHHTIDIRKGYLNGRYGAIPFLGNLQDLNWDKYAEA